MRYNIGAFDLVPENTKEAARTVSQFLDSKGVSHAVIGGMAVSAYSPPRMTQDVDFLVPPDCLSQLRELGDITPLADSVDGVTVMMGDVPVDFLFLDPDLPDDILDDGPKINGIPVLRPEALFVMKMNAPRAKDHADVIEMLKAGIADVKAVRKYMKKHCPDMVEDFDSNIMLADFEKSGTLPKKKYGFSK